MNIFRKIEVEDAPAYETDIRYMALSDLYRAIKDDAAYADRTRAYWDGYVIERIIPLDTQMKTFKLTRWHQGREVVLAESLPGTYTRHRVETVIVPAGVAAAKVA